MAFFSWFLRAVHFSLSPSLAVAVRTIFGSVFALGGYALSKTGLVNTKLVDLDQTWGIVALSFIFGFAGERLIPSLVGSALGGQKKL